MNNEIMNEMRMNKPVCSEMSTIKIISYVLAVKYSDNLLLLALGS